MQSTLRESPETQPMAKPIEPVVAVVGSPVGDGVRFGAWVSKPFGDGNRLESGYEVETNGEVKRGVLWFQSRTHVLKPSGEALLAAGFFPALSRGVPLSLNEPVSERTLDHIHRLAEVFGCWLDLPRELTVQARRSASLASAPRRSLCCFSAGVDSFYSSLHGLEPEAALLFISGFDIAVDNRALLETVLAGIRDAAQSLNRELVLVETNARSVVEGLGVHWSFSHFTALAAVGFLLRENFDQLRVPSSHHYREIFPWGSSPLTDPWWSSEAMEFVHHGSALTRVEKVEYIANHPVAMKHLRVCWSNRKGAYNCGHCEKCIRTMVSLRAVGALDRCATFPLPLDLKVVARLIIEDEDTLKLVRENHDFVRRRGTDPALERALRYCRDQRFNRGLLRWMRKVWAWWRYT